MEWPHDPDGDEGSEGMRLYGQAIFAKKVEDREFPLDIESFAEDVGHHPIRIDHETVVPAADILDHVTVDSVEDRTEFQRELGTAMRAGEFWTYDPAVEVPGR